MTVNSIKKAAVVNTVWKFSERVIAQVITLLVSVILARLLSPEEFGIVSIVVIFFNFANVIISGGLNTALIQKKNADAEDYSTVLHVSVISSAAVYAVLFFAAPFIAGAYGQEMLVPVIRVMSLSLPVYAVKSVYCAYISATLQFRKFFFATLGGTLASAAVGIGMALSGFGAWSLVAQQVTNTVIDTLILVIITRIGLVFRISFRKLGSLFSYGWKVFVSSLLTTAYSEAVALFIGIRFTSSDLSFYTKGKLFPSTVSNTTSSTLSAVLFPVLSRFQDDREKLLSATRRFISVTSYVVFPMMLGFFAVADNFVIVLLTDKWADAIYYLRIFCIASMFDMIHTGNCETIKAMGRSDIFLIMEIVKKSSYFAVIAAFLFLGSTPQSLAVAAIVCTGIALAVNSFPNRKLIGYSLKQQAADILPNLLISVLMCACVMCIGLIPLNRMALLALQVISGALIFLALSFVTKNRNLNYLIGILREKRGADDFQGETSGDAGGKDDE